MILIVGRLQIKPGQTAAFLDLAREIVPQERQVEGCAGFDILQDVTHPAQFIMMEQWRDRSALDRHLAGDAYAQNSTRVESFMVDDGDWVEYEV